MTYVVTQACIKCKHTDCVDVCPAEAFREGPLFLVIEPDYCIECALCVTECPVRAIFARADVPEDQRDFIALNAELSEKWAPIVHKKEALPDAQAWVNIQDKRRYLDMELEPI